MTILIVDDEPSFLTLFRIILRGKTTVIAASGGQEALERLTDKTQTPPDLVLTDLQMSKMNGIDLAEKIYELGFQIPVVIMSVSKPDSSLSARLEALIEKNIIIGFVDKAQLYSAEAILSLIGPKAHFDQT